MFEFHKDRKGYFDMQVINTKQYVIPFIEEKFEIRPGMRVLEIGCGEGGVLKAFVDKGCVGVGVELDEPRLINAAKWLEEDIRSGKIKFISKDIYLTNIEELGGLFDLIVLKDVIEHIHDQEKLIRTLKEFLTPGGSIYFGFPPWQMPFGGHQQICKGKVLSKLPYYHLLPAKIYRWILARNGEPVETLMEIKETGISIERFERITKRCGYKILNKKYYLINPIYEYKFGWKPKEQFSIIKAIPYLRNFFTTCVYYVIQRDSNN